MIIVCMQHQEDDRLLKGLKPLEKECNGSALAVYWISVVSGIHSPLISDLHTVFRHVSKLVQHEASIRHAIVCNVRSDLARLLISRLYRKNEAAPKALSGRFRALVFRSIEQF